MGRPSKNYTAREKTESRSWETILYLDSTSYNCEELLNRLQYYWQEFAYILHDKDVYTDEDFDEYCLETGIEPNWKVGDNKKPHYHVYGFSDPCLLGRAATKFGVRSNMVAKIKNKKQALRYLIHLDHKNKYQYRVEEIITNIGDIGKYMKTNFEAEEKAKMLTDFILSGDNVDLVSTTNFALSNNCWDELRRGQHIYMALIKEANYLKLTKEKEKKQNES